MTTMDISKFTKFAYKKDNAKSDPKETAFRVELITTIILIGFSLTIFYQFILGTYLGLGIPYTTFLAPTTHFSDFDIIINESSRLSPYSSVDRSAYLPLTYLIGFIISFIPKAVCYTICVGTFMCFFVYFHYRNLQVGETEQTTLQKIGVLKNTFILCFLTYPILFMIDRGNLDFVVIALLLLFAYYYVREQSITSCLFLAFAIALKGYPAIFLLVFLADKRYKEIIIATVTPAVISFVGFFAFKGGFINNVMALLTNVKLYSTMSLVQFEAHRYTSNCWGAVRAIFEIVQPPTTFATLFSIVSIVTALSLILICIYALFVETELWKIVTLLTMASLTLGSVTFDYRLVLLFLPLYLFILHSKEIGNLNIFYCVCFALLLMPKNIIITTGGTSISVILNPLLMCLLAVVIMWQGFKSKYGQSHT